MAIDAPLLAFGVESIPKYTYFNDVVFGGRLTNKGLFMIALTYGFRNGKIIEDFRKSQTGPRTELDDQDFALMSAVQLAHTSDPESLMDTRARNELAQQFAEGGIREIYKWLIDKDRRDPRGDFITMVLLESNSLSLNRE